MFSRAGRAALFDRKPFTDAYFDADSAADAAILVSIVAAVTYVGSLLVDGAIGLFSFPGLFQVVIAGVVSWLVLGSERERIYDMMTLAARSFNQTAQVWNSSTLVIAYS